MQILLVIFSPPVAVVVYFICECWLALSTEYEQQTSLLLTVQENMNEIYSMDI